MLHLFTRKIVPTLARGVGGVAATSSTASALASNEFAISSLEFSLRIFPFAQRDPGDNQFLIDMGHLLIASLFGGFEQIALQFSNLETEVVVQHLLEMGQDDFSRQDGVVVGDIGIGKFQPVLQLNLQPMLKPGNRNLQRLCANRGLNGFGR